MTTIALPDKSGWTLGWLLSLPVRFVRWLFAGSRLFAVPLLIAMTAFKIWNPPLMDQVEAQVFDIYQQIKPRPAPESQVAIIDIDESSLAVLGQWPWSRKVVADIVHNAAALGAQGIGFDVVFAEPDNLSPGSFAKLNPDLDPSVREALSALPSNDTYFAQVIKRTRAVLGQAERTEARAEGNAPPSNALAVRGLDDITKINRYLLGFRNVVGNLPELEQAAVGRGMFVTNPETDGVVRRVPAILQIDGKVYPTLSIEMLRVAAGASTILVRADERIGVQDVVLQGPNFVIPTDSKGRLWPHYAKYNPDRYIPAKDILNATVDPEKVRGKLMILGTSAAGLRDIRASPVDDAMPGVEVHAQLIESILNDALLTQPAWTEGAERTLTFVIGVLMIVALAVVGAKWTLAVFVVVAVALFGGSWYLFTEEKMLVDVAFPVMTAFLIYLVVTYLNYMREEAERQKTRAAFGMYLAPAMVERIAANPGALKLGGEMREMTLMFSDLRGFTTISEMYDAEGLTHLMNRFLTPMTGIIQGTGGTIDKYIGDCIMAFWNAPEDTPQHRRQACRAALQMREGMIKLNAELKAEAEANNSRYVPLAIGVGLNTGVCCVGNMGSEQKFNYSVLGDAVNLASRLEGQSKSYHYDLVIGETTYPEIEDWAVLELDLIQVKGKTVPVRIFTAIGDETLAATPEYKALRENHDRMITSYRTQAWDVARAALGECVKLTAAHFPEISGLYEVYAERISGMQDDPPGADWDGVYVAKTK